MRVLVCGDRHWNGYTVILRRLKSLPKDTVIIHSDCRGADRLAGAAAKKLGLKVKPYPAKWKEFGRAAGPTRNQEMLDEGKPDLVIAFHSNMSASKGTANMVARASMADIPIEIITKEQ